MRITFEKILFLKTIPLFENIPEPVLSDIVGKSQEISAIMGSDIIKEGDVFDAMYIIIQGTVRIAKGGKTLAELGKGSVLGEVYVFDPVKTNFSVTAIDDTLMFVLDKDILYNLIGEHPDIAKAFIPDLCRRLRKADAKSF